MSPVIERRTSYDGTAFAFFSQHPNHCTAILEDPSGGGTAWVVSRAGASHRLTRCDARQLPHWNRLLTPPADGGAEGIFALIYLSYEAGGLFEELPAAKPSAYGRLPLLYAHHPEWSLRFSPDGGVTITARSSQALAQVEALLRQPRSPAPAAPFAIGAIVEDGSAADYRRAVTRVQAFIRAGDIFQANIARFWHAPIQHGDALALYSRLRRCNPAPFSCLLRLDGHAIVSASPERLVRITPDGVIDTRPIAGTRKIGSGSESDQLREELLLSAKERAEHIMLVDLERNDLGRICQPGSVTVDESMVIERYSTVQHIVSNVRGRLRPEVGMMQVLATMFPGGTITGCPKIRCMEIIHQLEPAPRGPYTGGVGYIGWNGAVDINILIRTFWMEPSMLHWAAGAGIVSDSNPRHEQRETEHKAAGLLAALGM